MGKVVLEGRNSDRGVVAGVRVAVERQGPQRHVVLTRGVEPKRRGTDGDVAAAGRRGPERRVAERGVRYAGREVNECKRATVRAERLGMAGGNRHRSFCPSTVDQRVFGGGRPHAVSSRLASRSLRTGRAERDVKDRHTGLDRALVSASRGTSQVKQAEGPPRLRSDSSVAPQ